VGRLLLERTLTTLRFETTLLHLTITCKNLSAFS